MSNVHQCTFHARVVVFETHASARETRGSMQIRLQTPNHDSASAGETRGSMQIRGYGEHY